MEKNRKIIVGLFFAVYLFVGLSIYRDYGISWDEPIQRGCAYSAYDYVVNGDKSFLFDLRRFYGTAFELPLVFVERVIKFSDIKGIYFMRHLAVFLIFYMGVFFFYRLLKYEFKDWKTGILGALFLVLSPRIFADSFYNSKDIPFMAVFIAAIYTLVRFLNKKNIKTAFFHAFACGFLIALRVTGVIVPFFTVIFFIADIFLNWSPARPFGAAWRGGVPSQLSAALSGGYSRKRDNKRFPRFKQFMVLLFYAISLGVFCVILWPALWQNTFSNFIMAFLWLGNYPHLGEMLYLGNYIKEVSPPWHYIPVWIGVTTPLAYILFFLAGFVKTAARFFRGPVIFYRGNKTKLIFLSWLVVPLAAVIILRSTLYDAWRHMFFIYPAFLFFTLEGIYAVSGLKGKIRQFAGSFVFVILAVCLFITARFMVISHPFQNVYFNSLAGGPGDIYKKFERDYWGLSYRKALEYIAASDNRQVIKVRALNFPGETNSLLLEPGDRRRILFTDSLSASDYFITNYRGRGNEDYAGRQCYFVTVNGVKIMGVYRLRP